MVIIETVQEMAIVGAKNILVATPSIVTAENTASTLYFPLSPLGNKIYKKTWIVVACH